jgi:hypothetical protein
MHFYHMLTISILCNMNFFSKFLTFSLSHLYRWVKKETLHLHVVTYMLKSFQSFNIFLSCDGPTKLVHLIRFALLFCQVNFTKSLSSHCYVAIWLFCQVHFIYLSHSFCQITKSPMLFWLFCQLGRWDVQFFSNFLKKLPQKT